MNINNIEQKENVFSFSLVAGIVPLFVAAMTFAIIYMIWPESFGRQIVGTGAAFYLFSIFLFREKQSILILSLLFFSQFIVSLTSFSLNPPVKLLILFTDTLLVLFIAVALLRRIRLRLDWLGWLFLLFILWIAISSYYSAHTHRSLIFFLSQLKFLILYVLVCNTSMSEVFAKRIPPLVVTIIVIQALIGIAQALNGGPIGLQMIGEGVHLDLDGHLVNGSYRSSGTIGQTNGFAGYIAMLLIFITPFALAKRSLYLWGGFIFGVVALIITLSRAGWLSFIVGFICVLFMMLRASLVQYSRFIFFILASSLIISLGAFFYYDKIISRFEDRVAQHSALSRIHQFPIAFKVIEKHPIFGIGPGVTEFFGTWNDHRKYIKNSLPDVKMENQVHNSQLQVAIESGIPGGIIFLAIMGVVFGGAFWNVKKRSEAESVQLLRVGGVCAGIVIMTHVSFGTEFNSMSIFIVFWTLLGLSRSRKI